VKNQNHSKSRCAAIAKGNAIAKGVNAELDELRALYSGKEFLEGIENESHN
jgi:DNA mismatch repair ATPase MutS